MSSNKYPMYAVAAVAAGLAVWAGLPAGLLLLLVCPLMMFVMMRGMMGGGHSSQHDGRTAKAESVTGTTARPSSRQDGSHERIDNP